MSAFLELVRSENVTTIWFEHEMVCATTQAGLETIELLITH